MRLLATQDADRGAAISPSRSTSQPVSLKTACRAAARHVVLAAWPPVTKPTLAFSGSPSKSSTHAEEISSMAAAAGEREWKAAFWSHVDTNQSAASAAGSAPPMTKPKCRGPAVATRPGSAPAASASITAAGSSPRAGSGPPRALRTAEASARAATGRSSSVARNASACSAAARRPAGRSGMSRTYASGQVGGDLVERGDRRKQLGRVLWERPARQLGRHETSRPVDVDHLAVNPQAQHPIVAGVREPALVAVHAAGHAVVVGACRERRPRVDATGERVGDPGERHYALARQRHPAVEEQRPESGQVAQAGIDAAVEHACADRVHTDGGIVVRAELAPQQFRHQLRHANPAGRFADPPEHVRFAGPVLERAA